MSGAYPADTYRRPSGRRITQGDIAIAEHSQLRARSSDKPGPGAAAHASPQLPFFGMPNDFEIEIPTPNGRQETRVLRVWTGYVLVLHQACELEFADDNDSRLLVAPLASTELWPEAPWSLLRQNQIPGYFYLPPIPEERALELGLPGEWPESVVCLASTTLSSNALIKPRRELSLTPAALPILQDTTTRFFAVRGFADIGAARATEGKRLLKVVETNQTIPGPSKLVKLYFGEEGGDPDDADDELSLACWGVRPTRSA
jgi:hypothetical protein